MQVLKFCADVIFCAGFRLILASSLKFFKWKFTALVTSNTFTLSLVTQPENMPQDCYIWLQMGVGLVHFQLGIQAEGLGGDLSQQLYMHAES